VRVKVGELDKLTLDLSAGPRAMQRATELLEEILDFEDSRNGPGLEKLIARYEEETPLVTMLVERFKY